MESIGVNCAHCGRLNWIGLAFCIPMAGRRDSRLRAPAESGSRYITATALLRARLPHAQVEAFPGLGHLLMMEAPQASALRYSQFLDALARQPQAQKYPAHKSMAWVHARWPIPLVKAPLLRL